MHTEARAKNNRAVASSSRPATPPSPRIGRAQKLLDDRLRDSASGVWELVRFCVVGASGYLVNLSVYAILIHAGLHYLPAAVGSFSSVRAAALGATWGPSKRRSPKVNE